MSDLDFTLDFGIPSAAPYSISKAALNMLIVKYHNVYKFEGILFMGISPGLVATAENKVCTFFPCLSLFLVPFLFLEKGNADFNPDTDEQIEGAKQMISAFKVYAPDFEGPISPQTSVDMVLKVVDEASVEESGGSFVSHYGNKQWLWVMSKSVEVPVAVFSIGQQYKEIDMNDFWCVGSLQNRAA